MNEQLLTADEIIQLKGKEMVFVGNQTLTAKEAAECIAYKLFGLSGWQGVLGNGLYAESGLRDLMNKAIRKAAKEGRIDKNARIEEKVLGRESAYYPYWK